MKIAGIPNYTIYNRKPQSISKDDTNQKISTPLAATKPVAGFYYPIFKGSEQNDAIAGQIMLNWVKNPIESTGKFAQQIKDSIPLREEKEYLDEFRTLINYTIFGGKPFDAIKTVMYDGCLTGPILHMSMQRCPVFAKKLIEECTRGQINKQNDSGETPLHMAVYSNRKDLFQKILSRSDVNTSIRNNQGYDVRYFVQSRHPEWLSILDDYENRTRYRQNAIRTVGSYQNESSSLPIKEQIKKIVEENVRLGRSKNECFWEVFPKILQSNLSEDESRPCWAIFERAYNTSQNQLESDDDRNQPESFRPLTPGDNSGLSYRVDDELLNIIDPGGIIPRGNLLEVSIQGQRPQQSQQSQQIQQPQQTTNSNSARKVQNVVSKSPYVQEKLSDKEKINKYLIEFNRKFYNANIKVSTGEFKFEPPLENPAAIAEYNSFSNSYDWTIFGSFVQKGYNNKYDYVIAQMLKNQNFPIMKRYSSGYNVGCDPLFILTTLNKPYLLQEALKLPAADPVKPTGMNYSLSSWKRAVQNNIIDCAYVIMKSGKISQNDVDELKPSAPTKEMRELLSAYPNVDEYMNSLNQRYNEALTINIKNLEEVLTTPNVDTNFVDSNGNNILHLLSELDDEQQAIGMLENAVNNRKVDLNAKNKEGKTPIQIYLSSGKYALVAKMLSLKADVDVFNDQCENSFGHYIVYSSDEDSSIALLKYAEENGYDINKPNCAKVTPFMEAIKSRKYKLVNYFVTSGLSVNQQDKNGKTPLHFACMLNDTKLIEILLNSFADTKITDNSGKRAVDYLKNPDAIEFYKMFEQMK